MICLSLLINTLLKKKMNLGIGLKLLNEKSINEFFKTNYSFKKEDFSH